MWLRRGASRERGLSIPGPHSLGRTLGGPAVRCEKTSNGGLEVGRALVRCALAAPTVMPLALTAAHLPTILLENKNENRKIEEEEAKSTPFQPSPEMSWCPDIFFLFPNVKTKTTNPCFLPHELLCNPLVPSSGKRLVTYTLQKEFAEVFGHIVWTQCTSLCACLNPWSSEDNLRCCSQASSYLVFCDRISP